ncbi:YjjG family noncanonical pyrimidine nucleotidase [uncultured Secundilactobacillus sp.]|uniref:YjjG family noncanonical pyrimidine nucleotidase n=1 Tax=uncultured Secundilactobacillus sp. TaxID=2813935 RepID=UPI002586C399|nr:YjjG family noncanonical pyrimidine nucleotidase [uncultured Secundilactobacillus sp.]
MAYNTLLFDIDDTLLDFQASEAAALRQLFVEMEQPLTAADAAYYHRVNAELWQRYERGDITRPALLIERFNRLFEHMGQSGVDARQAEATYRRHLAAGHTVLPYAREVLQTLTRDHQLYVITNGIAATQRRRLRESGLVDYFNKVYISEVVGAKKPDPQFFESVAADITHFDKQRALVIGDSLSSDILGAAQFNVDSIWFNPARTVNASDVQPTFEVADLRQIPKIVG